MKVRGIRADAPTYVKTEKIEKNGTSYGTEYQLHDGLLRPRQIQSEGPDGGCLIADTHYDATATMFNVGGIEKIRTTHTYGGDRVHVDPPNGLTPTTNSRTRTARTEPDRTS